MLAPVYSTLMANSDVTAIVGNRIFPAGNIPQGQPVPAVTWQSIAGTPQNLLSEAPPVDNQRVQIDCWATTLVVADDLGSKVRAALQTKGYCISINGHDYDADAKWYRSSFDFSFWLPP